MSDSAKTTRILRIDPLAPEESAVRKAAQLLREGKLVAFPTDTLYGLGANATNADAIERVFSVKGRPKEKPLIVLARDLSMVEELTEEIAPLARRLMEALWPGPLTLVLAASPLLPLSLTGTDRRLGVRIPDSRISQSLLQATGLPLTATSANRSGGRDPGDAQVVWQELGGAIDLLLDGGPMTGRASTILDLTAGLPRMIRPGPVSLHRIMEILGQGVS
jgi:L-threonylcarbamoyladenylate synthase